MSDETDYRKLSPQKLHSMRSAVETAIRRREERQKALVELRAIIELEMRRWDFTPEELALPERHTTFRKKLAPKYRDPQDHARVWSGRGRTPVWFRDALAAGLTPLDMTIPEE